MKSHTALSRRERARRGGRFEGADDGRPDGNDAAAVGARAPDRIDGALRQRVPLRCHTIPVEVVVPDREERAGPDVQRDERPLDAARRERRTTPA
jgi:hypothetical protein